jgi:fructose-bisphosphate aldolase class II
MIFCHVIGNKISLYLKILQFAKYFLLFSLHYFSCTSLYNMGLSDIVPAGVVTGDNVRKVFDYAQEKGFAIPAINCTSTSTVNAALEAARDIKSPIIIQFSNGGSAYFAGKGLSNDGQKASILGAVAGANVSFYCCLSIFVCLFSHTDRSTKTVRSPSR